MGELTRTHQPVQKSIHLAAQTFLPRRVAQVGFTLETVCWQETVPFSGKLDANFLEERAVGVFSPLLDRLQEGPDPP